MNLDGTMNEEAGPFAGMTHRERPGRRSWSGCEHDGALVETEAARARGRALPALRHGRRAADRDAVVRAAWQPLAAPADRGGAGTAVCASCPTTSTSVYLNWLENIHDWSISRQLWWGHRIPVWYCQQCGETIVTDEETARLPARPAAAPVEQDPDVLDTWFSSGLWPFSTLGWPDDTADLRRFYPGSVMETGYDILFFWVARMVFFGLEVMGELPFHTVYLHGTVRDVEGAQDEQDQGERASTRPTGHGRVRRRRAALRADHAELRRATTSSSSVQQIEDAPQLRQQALERDPLRPAPDCRVERSRSTTTARRGPPAIWRWPTAGS